MKYEYFINDKKDEKINLSTNFDDVILYHQSIDEYKITPLYKWSNFAKHYKFKNLYIKDEAFRFNLNAFKGLGVSYATYKLKDKDATYVSCTDGNHGKALAWIGKKTGHKVIIFMPKGSSDQRVKDIEKYDATVKVTDMNYDDTVEYAYNYAKKNNYILIQDTALENYTKIPEDIVLGYTTLIKEALSQMEEKPTHVFLQCGVGSFAGAVTWYLANAFKDIPYINIIESNQCDCVYRSALEDKYVSISGYPETIMDGLNCGKANIMTLSVMKKYAHMFIRVDDEISKDGMKRSKAPIKEDQAYLSGPCGAVGLGLIENICKDDKYDDFKIDENSVILIINTEGELKNG